VDKESLDLVAEYCDIIQIGARNMQNFSLLKHAGRAHKPVMLKRGMAATIEEWLMAAENVMMEGNHRVVLCERGVRTFAQHTRNTLDLSVVPTVRWISHLPVIVDPSHGTGRREKVIPLARAGVAVGADGIMVEVHHRPEEALSDGEQALVPEQFDQLMWELGIIVQALGRKLEGPADGYELRRGLGVTGVMSMAGARSGAPVVRLPRRRAAQGFCSGGLYNRPGPGQRPSRRIRGMNPWEGIP
jgi:3-deoxy-7-phosphoheptulonate synthase